MLDPSGPSTYPPVTVKPARHYPFLARHPWVHAASLLESRQDHPLGTPVDLVQHDGTWLARGLFNPQSALRVRLYSWRSGESLDSQFFTGRIDAALSRRELAGFLPSDWRDAGLSHAKGAARLVFSESDGLSGLIVDHYANYLVVQLTAGVMAQQQTLLLDHLQQSLRPKAIIVRMDAKTALKEGLEPFDQTAYGELPQRTISYMQNGICWAVNLQHGQKTGAFLDQRFNHAAAAKYLSDRRVLDICCYTGGFGVVAAATGAESVLGIDSSARALELAHRNATSNRLTNIAFAQADCFEYLATEPSGFNAVVLDPPRFAGSRKQVAAALRAYEKLNRAALRLLPEGGVLVTNSCSGSVSREDFLSVLSRVGKRAGRDITILESHAAAPDHPSRVSCPETDYLKCFICEVR